MGTRADFYLGRNPKTMKWLGSIAWDGYPTGIPDAIKNAKSEAQFLNGVNMFLDFREDSTRPERGWPWPWETSNTTDYAYAFDEDKTWVACFGKGWEDAKIFVDDEAQFDYDWDKLPVIEFPDMTSIQNIAWDNRSGIMVLGVKQNDA